MRALLAYLDAHSGTVAALATIAGVVVATVYSFFAALQWWATRTQANITRAMFEASHRPYLNITSDKPVFLDDRIIFLFHLDNRGAVPAIVTRWHVTARSQEQPLPIEPATFRDVARAVFPNDEPLTMRCAIRESDGLTIRRTDKLVLIETTVTYRGVAKRDYRTRAVWELTSKPELDLWACRELRMDLSGRPTTIAETRLSRPAITRIAGTRPALYSEVSSSTSRLSLSQERRGTPPGAASALPRNLNRARR